MIPRILIIDDQFGRSTLGAEFRKFIGEKIFAMYLSDRMNLCEKYGLEDKGLPLRGEKNIQDPIAQVEFCSGQLWNPDTNQIVNDVTTVIEAVRRGWPFNDGARWSLILLDIRFTYGKIDFYGDPQEGSPFGIDVLLPTLRKNYGEDLPIVILSSTQKEKINSTIRSQGALDFLQRTPGAGVPANQARKDLKKALFNYGLMEDPNQMIVGKSLKILKALRQGRLGAKIDGNILLLGETGTGKDLFARYIHSVSPYADRQMITYETAHTTATLREDAIFGHWKGAFTGADCDKPGVFEEANNGVLFLNEIGNIDGTDQKMLLSPIEDRKVRRQGRGTPDHFDLKFLLIMATNSNLAHAVKEGKFRLDLLSRINSFEIELPPLRDRKEDIYALIPKLVREIEPYWQGHLLPDAMGKLLDHSWSNGNIRELRAVLENAITLHPDQDLTADDIILHKPTAELRFQKSELSETDSVPSKSIFEMIFNNPDLYKRNELEKFRNKFKGALPLVLARMLIWALELTRENNELNPTAAVRLILARDVQTMEAKAFLQKALKLDTKKGTVWQEFAKYGKASSHDTLKEILDGCINRYEE